MLKNRRKRILNCHYLSMSDRRVFMATIAFLGLGQMGSPMANNLLQKGHSLQVFDVNTLHFSGWGRWVAQWLTIYCKKGIHYRYLMSIHRPSMR
ncbi:TPA: NAD(P)-binding domain-containing protein [Escherichia coli]